MERYLLFDSRCGLCSKLAQDIEEVAEGWLVARSLGDQSMRSLLKEAKPNWRWQPTLLEIEGQEVRVVTGPTLAANMVAGLGPRRAWRAAQLMHHTREVQEDRVDIERRYFLHQSGALLAAASLLGLPTLRKSRLLSFGTHLAGLMRYRDPDFGFSLEYPFGWQVEIKEVQSTPLIDDEAILKRVAFSSSPSLIYLDIWLTKGKK